MSPAVHQDVPAPDPSGTQTLGQVSHQCMRSCDIEEGKRNLILLQCCDKLLFPVVISESIRMDVVEGKWRLGVVIVASGTALGRTSVVSLALPGTAVMVVTAARDVVVVETTTGAAVVGRSENQEQQWNLGKASTQSKSQMVTNLGRTVRFNEEKQKPNSNSISQVVKLLIVLCLKLQKLFPEVKLDLLILTKKALCIEGS